MPAHNVSLPVLLFLCKFMCRILLKLWMLFTETALCMVVGVGDTALATCPRTRAVHTKLQTFKMLHNSMPRYLEPRVPVADLPDRRTLQSASTSRLVVPPIKLSTVGSRAFPVATTQVWSGLPEAVVSSSSLQTFYRQLKTHLFQLSYPHLIF